MIDHGEKCNCHSDAGKALGWCETGNAIVILTQESLLGRYGDRSRRYFMESVVIRLDELVMGFYRRVAEATGVSVETVISDALFKLAGELSLEALSRSCR